MQNSSRNLTRDITFCFALASLVVVSRFSFGEIPNFKPIAAISLFAAILIRDWRVAFAGAFLGKLVSDACFGFGDIAVVGSTYICLLFNVVIGRKLAEHWDAASSSTSRISGAFVTGLIANLQFFFVTNFCFWAFNGWYPKTSAGLLNCMIGAIPFWKYSAMADAVFFVLPCVVAALAQGVFENSVDKKTRVSENACP